MAARVSVAARRIIISLECICDTSTWVREGTSVASAGEDTRGSKAFRPRRAISSREKGRRGSVMNDDNA
eukprot:16456-Eustigmatos_ZCMA.PRE.1